MRKDYYAVVYPKDSTGFHALFIPDIPEVMTQGRTLDELEEMATDALATIADDYQSRHKSLPEPSDYDEVARKLDRSLGPIAFILPVKVYPSKKVTTIALTGQDCILHRIKDYAGKTGTSRSALMIKATLEHIEQNGG